MLGGASMNFETPFVTSLHRFQARQILCKLTRYHRNTHPELRGPIRGSAGIEY